MPATRLSVTQLLAAYFTLTPVPSLQPQDVGASASGVAADMTGEEYVTALVAYATASATTVFTPKIEKSANGSSGWEDVAAGDILTGSLATITTANDETARVLSVKVDSAMPFMRISFAGVGGTQAMIASGSFVKGRTVETLKPYMLDQIDMALRGMAYDHGSGEPQTNQPVLGDIFG